MPSAEFKSSKFSSTEQSQILTELEELEVLQQDLPYEQDILRNPLLKNWLQYIKFKESQKGKELIYERALIQMPRSYKLWKGYLELKLEYMKTRDILKDWREFEHVCFMLFSVFESIS